MSILTDKQAELEKLKTERKAGIDSLYEFVKIHTKVVAEIETKIVELQIEIKVLEKG